MIRPNREQVASIISNAVDSGYSLSWRDLCLHLADELDRAGVLARSLTMYGDVVDDEYVDMICDSENVIVMKDLIYVLWGDPNASV